MKDIGTGKAAGIERLSGRFLKDGAGVLAKSVTDFCNLLKYLNKFPSAFKLAKVKPTFQKVVKLIPQITNLPPYCYYFLKSLKILFRNKQLDF